MISALKSTISLNNLKIFRLKVKKNITNLRNWAGEEIPHHVR
jgi:hypothetical protein